MLRCVDKLLIAYTIGIIKECRASEARVPKDPIGALRTLTLALDTSPHQLDVDSMVAQPGAADIHAAFNLLQRRQAKGEQLAVLGSIRDLTNQGE
jgi:hypothetical protein